MAFVVPLDGFGELNRRVGASLPTLASYVATLFLLPTIPRVLRDQARPLWYFAGAFALGTIGNLLHTFGATANPMAVTTPWLMLALMAFVSAAGITERGYRIIRTAVFCGLAATSIAYLALYQLGIDVSTTQGRVAMVAGYQSNQGGEAAAAMLIVLMAIVSDWTATRRLNRLAYLAIGAVGLTMLVMTNSRGATLMFLAGLVPFALARAAKAGATTTRRARSTGSGRAVLLIAVIALGGLVLSGSQARGELWNRFANRWLGQQNLADLTTGRTSIFATGLEISREYPQGLGLGRSSQVLAQRSDLMQHGLGRFDHLNAHNEFLRTLLECGWLGLALFLIGWAILLRRAFHLFRLGRPEALAIMLALTVSFNTGTAGSVKLSWVLLGLVSALVVSHQRLAATPGALRRSVPHAAVRGTDRSFALRGGWSAR